MEVMIFAIGRAAELERYPTSNAEQGCLLPVALHLRTQIPLQTTGHLEDLCMSEIQPSGQITFQVMGVFCIKP